MPKQVVSGTKVTMSKDMGQGRIMQQELELTKVWPLDTTLEELRVYCSGFNTNHMMIIFESDVEAPPKIQVVDGPPPK